MLELGPNYLFWVPWGDNNWQGFYNSIDVFINPSLRAQATGFVSYTVETMLSGVMATKFASITGPLIVGPDIGYTFSVTVDLLKESFHRILDLKKEYSWRKVRFPETQNNMAVRER